MTLSDIRAAVAAQRPRKRALGVSDIDRAAELAQSARIYVRVYSSSGFVPNAYKWRAEIQYIQAARASESDAWAWSIGWTGAHRPNGRGSLEVIR